MIFLIQNRKHLLQLSCVFVPLFLFFISDQVIGFFQHKSDNKVQFSFTLPLDKTYADEHNLPLTPNIEKVFVTGFFTDWSQDHPGYQLKETTKGHWQLVLQMPPGKTQYKFVIFTKGDEEGKWLTDPGNPKLTSDSYGGYNSLLERPDYALYQLLADIFFFGLFLFFAALFSLQRLMKWLMTRPLSLANTFIIGTMLVVLLSNVSLAFYQVFESRKLIQQGILDAIHQSHLYLQSQQIRFGNLPTADKALQKQLRQLFWNAKTRVESAHGSITQITLSDIAIYDPNFNLLGQQSRQQNYHLQLTRAEKAGYDTLNNYFTLGVFGPLLEAARAERSAFGFITAHPASSIIDIETPETRLSRNLLGFSNMLVPILEDNQVKGYYAVAVQVKLFGKEILRIISVNILLVVVTLLFAFLLLRSVGRIASSNLKQLTQWTQKINQGDLSTEVQITTNDEIKLLADNFSEMQHSLKSSFSKIEQQNIQLNKAAYFDLDTQLPNLNKLQLDFKQARSTSVLVLELTKLEQLQRFLGDKISRQLVMAVYQRISSVLESSTNVQLYRTAPCQFCLVSQDAQISSTETLANTLITDINNDPMLIDNMALDVCAAAGLCCLLKPGETISEQLERASLALTEAKSQGLPYCLYKQVMDKGEQLKHNINIIKQVRTAIQKGKVLPFYQPIVATNDKSIVSLECLVRIKESDNLILSPASFLETTKQAGLYQSISQIMFEKTFQTLRQSTHRLSLNISAQDIENQQSREFIVNLIEANRDIANRVTLELTETEQLTNYDLIKHFIDRVKAWDVKIALDDFGAGYSNFGHLLSLSIDFLKIDGSLIKDLDQDMNAMKVTKGLVECARSLGIKMVAEYVHNETIYQLVKELGIEYCQGYLFGAPSEYLN